MSTWTTTRPARALTVLDAIAWWPVWVGALILGRFVDGRYGPPVFVIFEGPYGPPIFLGVGAIVVLLWARTQRPELPSIALRTPRGWFFQCGFALLAIVLGVRWDDDQLVPMAIGCTAACVAGAWQLVLSRRARDWLTGTLRIDADGIWIDAGSTRFVLEVAPAGCRDDDVLTLPSVRVDETAEGPYRSSGLAHGHAPEVWRIDGFVLERRLAWRGRAMIAWAIITAIWMAL